MDGFLEITSNLNLSQTHFSYYRMKLCKWVLPIIIAKKPLSWKSYVRARHGGSASIPITKSLSNIWVILLVWIQGHNSRTENERLVLKVAYCFIGYQLDAKKKQWTMSQRMVGFNNWAEIHSRIYTLKEWRAKVET